MARKAAQYVCSNCGAASSSWSGKCPQCGEWNTLQEQLAASTVAGSVSSGRNLSPETVASSVKQDKRRLQTGMPDIDAVLGGGLVAGSVNLIAGQPGIGKSTLLLQLAHAVASTTSVLYISGEESAHQIGLRAQRLGTTRNSKLQLATSTSADDIAAIADPFGADPIGPDLMEPDPIGSDLIGPDPTGIYNRSTARRFTGKIDTRNKECQHRNKHDKK